MKYRLLFGFLSLILFVSCGEDNDDFVKPEDVSNIDLEKGITFGILQLNCVANCAIIYVSNKNGFFTTDATLATKEAPNNFTVFDCPISEETRFVSRADGIQNVPRGLRDVPSINIVEKAKSANFPSIYFIEYTLKNGVSKTIPFFNGSNSKKQLSEYYSSVINIIESLASLNTKPTDCKK